MNKSSFCILVFYLVFTFASIPISVHGQTKHSDKIFTVMGGYSFSSVQVLGKTPDSQTQIFSLGYQQRIYRYFTDYSFWYTAEFIPYIHYDYPKRDEDWKRVSRSGIGFSPVGFLLTYESSKFLTPYLKTSGGIIYMEDEFPTDKAKRLNFTFEMTAGAEMSINSYLALSFGYKFHHISNAETGSENPGLDSNILFLKLTIQ